MAGLIYHYAIVLTTGLIAATTTSNAQLTSGNAISSLDYEILNVLPDNNSDTTILPCWNRTAGRSGRIVLRRKHFLNSQHYNLTFQLLSCPTAASLIPSTNSQSIFPDVLEDLFIDVRAGQLDASSMEQERESVTVASTYKINSLGNYGSPDNYGRLRETMTASHSHFHAMLRQERALSHWTGPLAKFEVILSRPQFSFFSSSNKFTADDRVVGLRNISAGTETADGVNTTFDDLNNPELMEKDFLTIDYTVTLRQRYGSLSIAEKLQQNNITDIYYCPRSRGFIPKSLCPNFLQNSLNITACPRVVSIGVSTAPISPVMESSECLDLPTAIWLLTATTPSPPTTTWRPYYNDRYDYTRLWVGMGVSLGILLLMCCCGICRHVFKDCYYRKHGAGVPAASVDPEDGTRRLRTSSPRPRENRTTNDIMELGRYLDAPPSYEDIVRSEPLVPYKEPEGDLTTVDAGLERPVPLAVIASSSRTTPVDSSE